MTIDEYNFYYRHIRPHNIKNKIWQQLQFFYKNNDYVKGFDLEQYDKYKNDIIELRKLIDDNKTILKSFSDMILLEQLKIKNWIDILSVKNPKYLSVLKFVTKSLKFNTIEELDNELLTQMIKYRKNIYNLSTKKVYDDLDCF